MAVNPKEGNNMETLLFLGGWAFIFSILLAIELVRGKKARRR
jgi:hypothetical protein